MKYLAVVALVVVGFGCQGIGGGTHYSADGGQSGGSITTPERLAGYQTGSGITTPDRLAGVQGGTHYEGDGIHGGTSRTTP